jgi:hypothetical protein
VQLVAMSRSIALHLAHYIDVCMVALDMKATDAFPPYSLATCEVVNNAGRDTDAQLGPFVFELCAHCR